MGRGVKRGATADAVEEAILAKSGEVCGVSSGMSNGWKARAIRASGRGRGDVSREEEGGEDDEDEEGGWASEQRGPSTASGRREGAGRSATATLGGREEEEKRFMRRCAPATTQRQREVTWLETHQDATRRDGEDAGVVRSVGI
ncbi:hypothetical protein Tdes44962_MAKER09431 [Teratosphaeria destructans]|uniref:Uncharacterized protein n=1 Tax=Teratosphaeria destructans TaxID=418781 RepID=A0A9W7ST88_9PEZI|nr:hypothetical protein Tdes44962_MAKER09431 [Teratosphaeria destructans]